MTSPRIILSEQQSTFVEDFISRDAGVDVLVGPTGVGKAAVAAEVIARILGDGGKSVLVVADAFIGALQLAERAAADEAGLVPLTREWAWSRDYSDPTVWPEVVVAYGARSQIARPPLDQAVHRRDWDIIVIDGSWSDPEGRHPSLVESVEWLHGLRGRSVRTLVLLDAAFPQASWEKLSPSITRWSDPDLPFKTPEEVRAARVSFSRSPAERELAHAANEIRRQVTELGLPVDTQRLDEALDSSPFALHSSAARLADEIRHLRNRIAGHGRPGDEVGTWSDTERWWLRNLRQVEGVAQACRDLAERASQLPEDSKFRALSTFLEARRSASVVVMTESSATARYLASRLKSLGEMEVLASPDFASENGVGQRLVIVAHDAQLKGVEIPDVDVVVFYDIPTDLRRLYIRLTRVAGRSTETEIVYLLDEETDIPRVKRAVKQLQDLVDPPPRH